MKKIIKIISILIYTVAYSQKDAIVNFSPKSPEVASLGKYLDKPISLSTGTITLDVPLYNLQVDKDLSIPIGLNYNTGGVQVNEVPGMVGLGWNLIASGNITRNIRGKIDVVNQPSYFQSTVNAAISKLSSGNLIDINNYMEQYGESDFEPDEYNITLFNTNFTFYYDYTTDKFVSAPVNDYKIEPFIFNTVISGFKIIDPVGNQYFFGSNQETGNDSYSSIIYDSGGAFFNEDYDSSSAGHAQVQSWMLVKIVTANNKKVRLFYENANNYSLSNDEVIRISQFMYVPKTTDFDGLSRYDIVIWVNNNPIVVGNYYPITKSLFDTNKTGKILNNFLSPNIDDQQLKKIIYDDISIEFKKSQNIRKDINAFALSEVEVIYKNQLKKKFKFQTSYFNDEYTTAMYDYSRIESGFFSNYFEKSRYRLRLDKLIELNATEQGNEIKSYSFEYFPGELPSKLSYAQDFWGYYNGKVNNKSLIPIQTVTYANGYAGVWGNADRSIDLNFSKIGMLKRIKYPTKGYLDLEYENHTFEAINDYNEAPILEDLLKIKMLINFVGEQSIDPNTNQILMNDHYEVPFEVTASQSTFKTDVSIIETTSTNPNHLSSEDGYSVKLIDQNNVVLRHFTNLSAGDYFILPQGNYRIIAQRVNYNEPLGFNISLSYFDILKKSENVSATPTIKSTGGMRIKNMTHRNYDEEVISKTEYEYLDSQGFSSGIMWGYPILRISEFYKDLDKLYGVINFPLKSVTGSMVTYSEVTEKKINNINNESIKIKHYFENNFMPELGERTLETLDRIPKVGWKKNKLYKNEFFKTNTNEIVQKDSIEFASRNSRITPNFGLRIEPRDKRLAFAHNETVYYAQIYKYEIYPLFTDFSFVNKEIKTEYFDGNKELKTITNNIYGHNAHHQLTNKEIIFPDNKINTINYSYAHEKNNVKLINANMIGIPLETSTVDRKNANDVSGKLISKSETKYDNPSYLFPTSVLSYDLQNGTTQSTEITYDKYDSKGNLQQYTTKEGISTTIIWGYNNTQPIAKIDGAKLSDISQSLIDNIVNSSANDAQLSTDASEQSLISALDVFRNNAALTGYQITTYSYDPLIGVKSITPSSGIRELYKYDTANRLEKVIDINGKVLKEYKYNYKN